MFFEKDGQRYEVPDDAITSIKVNGETRNVSATAVIGQYNKVAAGDERLREANAAREDIQRKEEELLEREKEASDGIRFMDLSKRAETDDSAFRDLGQMIGLDPGEIESRLADFRGRNLNEDPDDGQDRNTDGTQQASGSQSGNNQQNAQGAAGGGQATNLSQEDRTKLDSTHKAVLDQTRAAETERMRNFLAQDDILGKLNVRQRETLLQKQLLGNVGSRLQAGEQYGPKLFQNALHDVRESARELGILPDEAKEAEDRLSDAESKGIDLTTLGPSGVPMADAVQAGKPIPRVPVTDPNYAENLIARSMLNPEIQTEA